MEQGEVHSISWARFYKTSAKHNNEKKSLSFLRIKAKGGKLRTFKKRLEIDTRRLNREKFYKS